MEIFEVSAPVRVTRFFHITQCIVLHQKVLVSDAPKNVFACLLLLSQLFSYIMSCIYTIFRHVITKTFLNVNKPFVPLSLTIQILMTTKDVVKKRQKTSLMRQKVVHPNRDLTNERVRLLLFVKSCNFTKSKDGINKNVYLGSWHLFTKS